MNRFIYSIVQISPKLSTGECVNFALVVGNDQVGDWAIRQVQDTNRARRFCGKNAMTAATEFISDLEERIDLAVESGLAAWLDGAEGTPTITEQLIDEVSTRQRGVVRLSPPRPVLADTAEEALALLTPDLLVEPTVRAFNRITKKRVVADVRSSYVLAGLKPGDLQQRPMLSVGRQEQFRFRSDFAVVTNRVLQLCSAWSFQIVDIEEVSRSVQAWGWNLRELRDHGGVLGDARTVVPQDVEVQVIVAPDPNDDARRALDDARSVFEEVGASVVAYRDRQRIADSALKLVS